MKPLAFYLPQFHPISENDQWWGKGFTEWTNVTRAKPIFEGHYQPHLPADLGFYDLRLHDTMVHQAELAKEYGIYGFIFYHYWFNGRLILNRPVEQWLEKKTPDFPFCLCWANENWTKRWDGQNNDILLKQEYSEDDDRAHIQYLIPSLLDKRYIRIDGKPLIFIYRSELLPNPLHTAEIWRSECKKMGIPDIYLVRIERVGGSFNPSQIGFDAAGEFAPDWNEGGQHVFRSWLNYKLKRLGLYQKEKLDNKIFFYDQLVANMMKKKKVDYKLFRGICPSWDNYARRKENATIFLDSTPEKYENWLDFIVKQTIKNHQESEQFILINAWNEWAEGCHLEPDQKFGLSYLEATKRVLQNNNVFNK